MTCNVRFPRLRVRNILNAMRRRMTSVTPSTLLLAAGLLSASGSLSAQPMWVSGPAVPHDATVGGYEDGGHLYVCRAWYGGGVHPGKVVGGNCNIGYGWREIAIPRFEVLAAAGTWAPSQGRYGEPLAAGHERGGPLYLCRALHNNGLHPGKLVEGRCHITWGGSEFARTQFEVFYAEAGSPWRRSRSRRFDRFDRF